MQIRVAIIFSLSALLAPATLLAQQAKSGGSVSYQFDVTVVAGTRDYKNAMGFLKARFAEYPDSWLSTKIDLGQIRTMEVSTSLNRPWKSKSEMDQWLAGKSMQAGDKWSAKACARYDGSLPSGQKNHNYNFTWTFQRQCKGKDCSWTMEKISMKLEPPCK